ncbi:hypothetical protein HZU75_00255 [Chitinibacter fontanus]|uniref:Uncharacterized protein n=1 Tax=Chitinibacter fontanus TaxID=1737446 RepID=A0A7D5V7K9_9NEIS|nr:hypothetical protein [Chitinibacter fontanus]QLI80094.1 hypothetical protein HZU75_00255 [Chitinibacter fontanus]
MSLRRNKPKQWHFTPDPLLKPGVYALHVLDEDANASLIDALARQIHALDQGALGILEAKPVFISNLRVWENIVLPSWYHSGEHLSGLDQRLQDFLAPLKFDSTTLIDNLALLPAQLDTAHRRIAALLRALLQQPKYLLIEQEWLTWLQQSRQRNTLLAQLYDAYTGAEYVFVITSEADLPGYTYVNTSTDMAKESSWI